jgi:HK97 gp10 family phage protein
MARSRAGPQIHRGPKKKRERRENIVSGTLAPARGLRHALHGLHHAERLFGGKGIEPFTIKGLFPQVFEVLAGAGGPLVITIELSVQLEDMDEIPDEAIDSLEGDMHDIMDDVGSNTVSEARSLAPVRTGRLRDSISYEADEDALMMTFRADTGYAIYQEDGTSKMSANPYLRGPAANAETELNSKMDDSISSRLDGLVQGDTDSATVDLEMETEVSVELITPL